MPGSHFCSTFKQVTQNIIENIRIFLPFVMTLCVCCEIW
ncbi:hypothetical protein SG9_0842 [Salmonella enterica subsp. enterica serovar Gallinarum str. SG9]|nr:hypothetical protein SG9_0842 [Salmonella enterica subsp. enterica serovar Gallinarum str. SG9]